jgi:hypothetical protein
MNYVAALTPKAQILSGGRMRTLTVHSGSRGYTQCLS